MSTINLSLSTSRCLMFGFDEYWGVRPLSVTHREAESMTPPLLVPKRLGKVLEELNTEEQLLHIIHFDNHSEAWHADHWLRSASRRWANAEYQEARSEKFAARRRELEELDNQRRRIADFLITKFPFLAQQNQQSKLMQMIASFINAPRQVTAMIPGLTEAIYGNK